MIGYELARVRKALEHAGLSHQFQTFTRYNETKQTKIVSRRSSSSFATNATQTKSRKQPTGIRGNIERFITEDVLLPLLLVVPHYSVQ